MIDLTQSSSMDSDKSPAETEYDVLPYESNPFEQTTPENLYTIAKLFKLDPVDFRKCKVLELGCASGGNIIPLAEIYPDCEFVGIDLSRRQISQGQEIIDSIGINNIRLEALSILEVDESTGKFDYIIAHGVYSWVPEAVRKKIISIAKHNLCENGVAYISYNTLPGWNMVKSIRDMMKFHVRDITDVRQVVPHAKSVLKFVHDSVENENSPYSNFLKQELEIISASNDYYLYHDHLETENNPCYLYEFMDEAKAQQLEYLGDTDLASMLLSNFPEEVVRNLQQSRSTVVTEQYMDFIRNRRFRSTLLCHASKSSSIARALTTDSIRDLYFSCQITNTVQPTPGNIADGVKVTYKFRNDKIDIQDRKSKIILNFLVKQNGKPVSFSELAEAATKEIAEFNLEQARSFLTDKLGLLNLAFKNIIKLYAGQGAQSNVVSDRPQVTKLVRFLSKKGFTKFPNLRHQSVSLPKLECLLLPHLDGLNNQEELAECLRAYADQGLINLAQDGKKITDETIIKQALQGYVKNSLEKLKQFSMLIT